MKRFSEPAERKVKAPRTDEERQKAIEQERKANADINAMLRSGKGSRVTASGTSASPASKAMGDFIRGKVREGESSDPGLAAALANASDEELNEIEAKFRRAQARGDAGAGTGTRIPEQALKSVSDVIRHIVRERKKRERGPRAK